MSSNSPTCQNLGPGQIRKRLVLGVLAFVIGLIMSICFVVFNVNDWIRAAVFIPYLFGYLGLFQAKQKTCVFLALQDKQNLDHGNESVSDNTTRSLLRKTSYGIILRAVGFALLCTYLTLALRNDILSWPV
jgi:hypothetical protein